MILPQIAPRITRLHNHLLAADRSTRERELVARAAPSRLGLAADADGGPAVGHGVVDGPGALVGAHEGAAAAVAAALGRAVVVQRLVVLAARAHQLAAVRLRRPPAARLAAVPVPRRLPRARGLGRYPGQLEQGREG